MSYADRLSDGGAAATVDRPLVREARWRDRCVDSDGSGRRGVSVVRRILVCDGLTGILDCVCGSEQLHERKLVVLASMGLGIVGAHHPTLPAAQNSEFRSAVMPLI
jgi:hypothetical protein